MTGQTARNHPDATLPRQRVAASQLTAAALSDALELLPTRAETRFGISLRIRESGTQFRVAPARDPHQPRLWCVSVRRCSPGGMLDSNGPIWIDRPGQTRTDVAELIETIRADIGDWLAVPVRRDLCRWLLTATPAPTAAIAAGLSQTPDLRRPR